MRPKLKVIFAAATAAFLLAGCGGGSSGPNARETVYNFIFNVKHGNYYTACHYYSDDILRKNGGQVGCANTFVYTAAGYMLLGGGNIWNDVGVKNGSYKELPNGDVQVGLTYKGGPGGTATVHKTDKGWRIVSIA